LTFAVIFAIIFSSKEKRDSVRKYRVIAIILIVLTLACLGAAGYLLVPHLDWPTPGGQQAETAPADTEPPEIHGVRDLVVGRHSAVAYRQGVTVTDNGGWVTLEVDSAGVDTDVPGEYTITYIARDAAGNETRQTATVTVTAVSEEDVALLADPILLELILPGATDTENALAIHTWIRFNISYTATGEKNSVLEGAYNGLTLYQGDCYTYYALSKYFLSRVGIASVDMQRVPEAETRHYWLAVDLGEGWHHYDACPVTQDFGQYRARSGFMMTETEVRTFAEGPIDRPDYYTHDPAELPEGVVIVP